MVEKPHVARATRDAERERLERAIDSYLRDCYSTPTVARVGELADLLGVNRAYLSRTVPALLGLTATVALRTRQLAYAAQLLENASLTVEEVASGSGFGTVRTFFRCFRAAYGVTPAEYRQKVTK